jgi:hypothetical protein
MTLVVVVFCALGGLITTWQLWRMLPHDNSGQVIEAVVAIVGWLIVPLLLVSSMWTIAVRYEPERMWYDWRVWLIVLIWLGMVVGYGITCVNWAHDHALTSGVGAGLFFGFFAAVGPMSLAARLDTWREETIRLRGERAGVDVAEEPSANH